MSASTAPARRACGCIFADAAECGRQRNGGSAADPCPCATCHPKADARPAGPEPPETAPATPPRKRVGLRELLLASERQASDYAQAGALCPFCRKPECVLSGLLDEPAAEVEIEVAFSLDDRASRPLAGVAATVAQIEAALRLRDGMSEAIGIESGGRRGLATKVGVGAVMATAGAVMAYLVGGPVAAAGFVSAIIVALAFTFLLWTWAE